VGLTGEKQGEKGVPEQAAETTTETMREAGT